MHTLHQDDTLNLLARLVADELESTAAPAITSRRPTDTVPLAYAQQLVWYLDQLQPNMEAYNLPHVLRLRGTLDVPLLQRCINQIVARHTSLRTIFPAVDGEPTVQILSERAISVALCDVQGCDDVQVDAHISSLILEPFDLATGPLIRFTLLQRTPDEYVLVSVFHHIIFDGWSLGLFTNELTELYAALAQEHAPVLPELPIEYADFATWQRQALTTGVLDTQLAYWKQQLDCDRSALALPIDYPRPPVQSLRGDTTSAEVSSALTTALRTLCRQENLTIYMVLLAGFQIVLHRQSGREDILVGSPIAGRTRAETDHLIGFFVNMVVLRASFTDTLTVRELLMQVRDAALGAYANQDLPFGALVSALQPERDLSHTPLFQVSFNLMTMPRIAQRLPDLDIQDITPSEGGSKFDMTLYVEEREAGLTLDLNYNPDLFRTERMQDLLQQFIGVLAQMVVDPTRRVTSLDLVTTPARAVLPDPQAVLAATWQGSIPALFAQQARQNPQHAAIIDAQGTWSYAELERRSNQLAQHLRALGTPPGSVVALYGHRSAALVQGLLGILQAGCAFVICDPAYPAARLAEIIDQVQPRALIAIAQAGPPPPTLATIVAPLPQISLAHTDDPLLDTYPATPPPVTITAESLACIGFTSGSTGKPKGIEGRHGSLTHFVPWLQRQFRLERNDRYSMLAGLAYDPLQREVFTPLCLGATICIPSAEQITMPGALATWMQNQAITIAHLTPAMGQMLTETVAGPAGGPLYTLRRAFFVGDVLTRRDVERLLDLAPNVTVVNYYGSTETQRAVSYTIAAVGEDGSGWRFAQETAHLGCGIDDVQLLVINAAGKQAGIGELGEIWMRSPHLARGYLNDSLATAKRFCGNPFTVNTDDRIYRTGDLGRYTVDGAVTFAGRADRQVKIRGFRVELGEIEATLARHPQVREAVVLMPQSNQRLTAYVVPRGSHAPEAQELRTFLKGALPDYMVPHAFVSIAYIPITPNDKVDRVALAELATAAAESNSKYVAPQSEIEQIIAAAWQAVLGLEYVGIDDNFFDLGGSSVHMIQVHNRLRGVAGDLSIVEMFFKYPTIRALVAHLAPREHALADLSSEPPNAQQIKQHQQLMRQQHARRRHHRNRS